MLIVEDDPGLQSQLRWSFEGFDVVVAGDRASAHAQMKRHQPPVVTLELGLPPAADGATEGLATLEQILEQAPDTKVIEKTNNKKHDYAVRAVGLGAYDINQKPFDPEILRLIVD